VKNSEKELVQKFMNSCLYTLVDRGFDEDDMYDRLMRCKNNFYTYIKRVYNLDTRKCPVASGISALLGIPVLFIPVSIPVKIGLAMIVLCVATGFFYDGKDILMELNKNNIGVKLLYKPKAGKFEALGFWEEDGIIYIDIINNCVGRKVTVYITDKKYLYTCIRWFLDGKINNSDNVSERLMGIIISTPSKNEVAQSKSFFV
jgi:hypothetical protein